MTRKYEQRTRRQKILDSMYEIGPGTAAEILLTFSQSPCSTMRSNLNKLLNDMIAKGEIEVLYTVQNAKGMECRVFGLPEQRRAA